jgi:hypothetical protein
MKLDCLFLAAVLVALPAGASAQEPYAPLIKPPAGAENTPGLQVGVAMVNASKVPPRDAVPQPPYPGAGVLAAADENPMFADAEFESLPVIRLLTTDGLDAVLKFYREKLPDWTYKEDYGFHFIYEGDGEYQMMSESSETTPSVTLNEVEPGFYEVMPDARTEITIRYRKGS